MGSILRVGILIPIRSVSRPLGLTSITWRGLSLNSVWAIKPYSVIESTRTRAENTSLTRNFSHKTQVTRSMHDYLGLPETQVERGLYDRSGSIVGVEFRH